MKTGANLSKEQSMHNKNLGFSAEAVARKWYERKGWTLANQNSRTRNSELDLIFYKKIELLTESSKDGEEYRDGLVRKRGIEYLFVEVKSLEIGQGANKNNLRPEDNFTKGKQGMFRRGIEQYLMKNKLDPEKLRVDLACVYHNEEKGGVEGEWKIKVYENIILE